MKPPDPKPLQGKHVLTVKKTSLKNIVHDNHISNRIQDAVIRTHTIVTHTTLFLKLYLLHLYNTNQNIPILTEDFISYCMQTVSNMPPVDKRPGRPPKPETRILLEHLSTFYTQEFEPLLGPNPASKRASRLNITDILSYEETDIIKNIKNNIFMHFMDYAKELINKTFGLKQRLAELDARADLTKEEKKVAKRNVSIEFRHIKEDLLSPLNTPYHSLEIYHKWIDQNKPHIIFKTKFGKDSLAYELKAYSLQYLKSMIHVCSLLEQLGSNHHPIPLRTSMVPSYITIDTTSLIMLMVDSGVGETRKRVSELKDQVWNSYFNLTNKAFKRKDYKFYHMIKTDGVGVSILMYRKDQDPNKIKDDVESKPELYVDEVLNPPKDKNIVGIDVGKDDILHCTDGELFYRYTANQRRVQTKSKKYAKMMDNWKKEWFVEGVSVKDWESSLSSTNKYTSVYDTFKAYIQQKLYVMYQLKMFYEYDLIRKLRWNKYMNTQRSEDKMVNLIKQKFGGPEHTVIAIGDFDQGSYHLKGKEPTKGKGMRKVLRRAGYLVFLVDEFRTSCICYNCHHRLQNTLYRESHRPKSLGQIRLVHGHLSCNTVNGCGCLWNRDVNGALNIRMLAHKAFNGEERPLAFQRTFHTQ